MCVPKLATKTVSPRFCTVLLLYYMYYYVHFVHSGKTPINTKYIMTSFGPFHSSSVSQVNTVCGSSLGSYSSLRSLQPQASICWSGLVRFTGAASSPGGEMVEFVQLPSRKQAVSDIFHDH